MMQYSDIEKPPKGAWYEQRKYETIVGASARQIPLFIFYSVFLIPWSLALLISFFGPLMRGDFIVALTTVPFNLLSVYFWTKMLNLLIGKIEVTADNNGGKIFVGNKYFNEIKEFRWEEVEEIIVNEDILSYPGSKNRQIQLIGPNKTISFGRTLPKERKYYLMSAMNIMKDDPFITIGS